MAQDFLYSSPSIQNTFLNMSMYLAGREFMVSIASLKPSSMQYDVHLWNFALPDFIFDVKAGYALGRGYVVIYRLIAQCPRDPALATSLLLPPPPMAPPHAHISRIRVFIFPSMHPIFSRWHCPDSKLMKNHFTLATVSTGLDEV